MVLMYRKSCSPHSLICVFMIQYKNKNAHRSRFEFSKDPTSDFEVGLESHALPSAGRRGLQERHGLQILFDDGVHDHLEDHLDVRGVGGSGEVVVDELVGRCVECHEGVGEEAGG